MEEVGFKLENLLAEMGLGLVRIVMIPKVLAGVY